MAMRTLNCETHGGTFDMPQRRGRYPRNCSENNPCAMHNGTKRKSNASSDNPVVPEELRGMSLSELRKHALTIGMSSATRLDNRSALQRAIVRFTSKNVKSSKPEKPVTNDDHVTSRTTARLLSLGWKVEPPRHTSMGTLLTAVRGEELITLTWDNSGMLVKQDYNLWSDVPKRNIAGMPAPRLDFNPDEIPDAELVARLRGKQIKWWNSLARSNETAVISGARVGIQHVFDGLDSESPADRVITFCDARAGGFRSFRLGALLRVG